MYLVTPESNTNRVRKDMTRPTSEAVLSPVANSPLQFLIFEDVQDTYETVERAGPLKKVL